MGLKEQRKHDKKRKAREAKRKELRISHASLSYDGDKYHTDFWAPYFFRIESAIYKCILESHRAITGAQIRIAIVKLIERLRKKEPVTLEKVEPVVQLALGREVDYLIYRIRESWQVMFDELEPISLSDLTGLHRSLLTSIDNQNNYAAGAPGYVNFLLDFIPKAGPQAFGAEEIVKLAHDGGLLDE